MFEFSIRFGDLFHLLTVYTKILRIKKTTHLIKYTLYTTLVIVNILCNIRHTHILLLKKNVPPYYTISLSV